jgi:hypothetical protein
MSLTVSQIYSVRFGTKLALPRGVQDNIAKLRITPVTYKPFRPPLKHGGNYRQKHESIKIPEMGNWREQSLRAYVSKIKDKDDKDYSEVFGILNKLTAKNMIQLSDETIEILKKRDQEFRLRVTTLLFDKAITESVFAGIFGDFAVRLNEVFPEIAEDFLAQANMFGTLYDSNTTLTYPQSIEIDFDDKVISWMKQKQKRRGYAKFLTQLFVRNMIPEDIILKTVQDVINELKSIASQPKSEQIEENTTQYVDFLFETAKVLPSSANELKLLIKTELSEILKIPRPELPGLCMRSRFRIEDTLKCVQ